MYMYVQMYAHKYRYINNLPAYIRIFWLPMEASFLGSHREEYIT